MSDSTASTVCPFCGSDRTELLSLFGQQLLTSQYYCNQCRTPFERVKNDKVLDDWHALHADATDSSAHRSGQD